MLVQAPLVLLLKENCTFNILLKGKLNTTMMVSDNVTSGCSNKGQKGRGNSGQNPFFLFNFFTDRTGIGFFYRKLL